MPIAENAVKVQHTNVAFLTADAGVAFGAALATGTVTAARVRGYIASIEGYLWGKTDGVSIGLRNRLDQVKSNGALKMWLANRDTMITAYAPVALIACAGGGVLAELQKLDHIAFDVKEASGHTYYCTPITANVAKQLTRTTNADRGKLQTVIGLFNETSCANNQAPIQTVAHLPSPEATYRIDREQLSVPPAPRYWTHRIQIGGATNGGILMETHIDFRLADLRQALQNSLASVALKAANQPAIATGFYVQISAPPWLRAIVTA